MKILYDYHMHSEISPDAHFSMEAMCESALREWNEGDCFYRSL